MKKYYKKIFKGTGIYSISSIIPKIGSILLLPVYTRLLSPEQYGIIGVLRPLMSFIPLVLVFGLYISQMKMYYTFDNLKKRGKFLYTINILLWIINLPLLLLLLSPIGKYLFSFLYNYKKVSFFPFITIAILYGFISIFKLMGQKYYQTIHNYKRIGFNRIFSFIISTILSLYLIYYFNLGALGKLLATLIGGIYLFVIYYIPYIKKFTFKINKKYLRESLKIGIPIMISAIMGILINYSDRIILAKYLDLKIVGLYSLAYTGSLFLNLIINSFNETWSPIFFEIMEKENTNKFNFIRKNYKNYIFVIAFFCLLGQFFNKEIIALILPTSYYDVTRFVPYILFGIFLSGVNTFYGKMFVYKKKTYFFPIFTFSAAIVNITINILLIPSHGAIVAAISTIVAFALINIVEKVIIIIKFKKFKLNYSFFFFVALIIMNPITIYFFESNLSIKNFLFKLLYFFIFSVIFIYKLQIIKLVKKLMALKRNEK